MSRRPRTDDPGSASRERRRQEDEKRQHEADIREMLRIPAGRRFLWWLISSKCNTFGGIFTGNSATFFNEGRRSIGYEVMEEIQNIDPDAYGRMVVERMNALKEFNSIEEAARRGRSDEEEFEDGNS